MTDTFGPRACGFGEAAIVVAIVASALATAGSHRLAGVMVCCALIVACSFTARPVVTVLISLVATVGCYPVIAVNQYAAPAVALSALLAAGIVGARRNLIVVRCAWLVVGYFLLLFMSSILRSTGREMVQAAILGAVGVIAYVLATNLSRSEMRPAFVALATFLVAQLLVCVREEFVTRSPLWVVARDSTGGFGPVNNFLQSTVADGFVRTTGTFGHPIPLATAFVVGLAVTRIHHSSIGRWVWAIYAVCILGCVFASARSALLAIAVVLVIAEFRTVRLRSFIVLGFACVGYALVGSGAVYELLRIDNLVESGSYSHRSRVLGAFPTLLQQPFEHLILGTGVNGERATIVTYTGDGFAAVDNQFISALITVGIFGLLTLVALLIAVVVHNRAMLVPVVGIAVMFMSYDALSWHSSLALIMAVLGYGFTQRSGRRFREEPKSTTAYSSSTSPSFSLL